jgi:hypothetical protein
VGASDTMVVVPVSTMNEATSELLADANDIVREQLALAWREHIEHVRDVLDARLRRPSRVWRRVWIANFRMLSKLGSAKQRNPERRSAAISSRN